MSRRLYITQDMMNDDGTDLPQEDLELLGIFPSIAGDGDLLVDTRWNPVVPEPGQCRYCMGEGFTNWRLLDEYENILVIEQSRLRFCQLCRSREVSKQFLPQAYKAVHFEDLKPYASISVPVADQQKLIDQVTGKDKERDLYQHSVLFSGPTRTGKTHLACALATRMIFNYIYDGFPQEYALPIYRLNAAAWIRGMSIWDTRDFEARIKPEEPVPNVDSILKFTHKGYESPWEASKELQLKYPPVILLEEIDKISPTPYKVNAFFNLLNAVFEGGGMIISTTNLREKELRQRFPDEFFRRLVESSIDGQIRHRDLFKAVSAKKPL
jgi:DNA replication protein DnaC